MQTNNGKVSINLTKGGFEFYRLAK
jgi:hypothetical protein